MRTPIPGFLMIVVVGCALLLLAALADRRAQRRSDPHRATVVGSQSDFVPAGNSDDEQLPRPNYVTADRIAAQARGLVELTHQQSDTLRQQLAAITSLDLTLADPGLVSHAAAPSAQMAGLSILDNPTVLVCAEPLPTMRELLTFLATAGRRVCLAAPAWDDATLETLVANHVSGKLSIQVLVGTAEPLAHLAMDCGARPVSRRELQSGLLPPDAVGTAATVVATSDSCWVLTTELVLS